MSDYSKKKLDLEKKNTSLDFSDASNPLTIKSSVAIALTNYSQEINRPKYDKDINDIIEVVRILNNLA